MAYVDFDLKKAVEAFGLIETDQVDLFDDVEPLEPSPALREFLD